ncbi:murein biosynthesis integral membrane protein MurJ [Insolitispirillum peregrinum]|uniref:Probable lipid II flippase MurJ n=1 Tax=Insolitispirillum peregrinum TaxID=80876 RepID=A0A1N7MTA8_9PROT|nr:murein biosynthesis integral membrane protein MurJ [Insolitispirillum peregrinum]SIS89079.1 putative peptidoglycan lipid II flippase [Insolitispirillum peregrinum]
MALMRSIATVGGFTMLSRVTGFFRDIMIANYLGAGLVADCFFVAFKFPNLFRRFFGEGAVAAAYVPLFSATLEKDGAEEARLFSDRAFSVMALALALFCSVLMIAMPWAMYAFAPGFTGAEGKHELAVDLTRITFPYLLLISLCSLISGLLNSLGKFAAAAGTPILLNLILMLTLTALTPFVETPGHALAWGVELAGLAQFVWLMISARRAGMMPRLVRPTLTPRVRLLIKRIIPVAFGAGLYQISLLIDTMLASMVADGAVSWLYYADRVNQLPLGVIGVAIGTALLPLLSRQLAAGHHDDAMISQNRSLEFALLLTVPSMAGFLVLGGPIISVLFERGAFSASDALATAQALMAFSLGLPAYVLVKVLSPGFFAREDTATPVKSASVALLVNIGLNLLLMQVMGHVGIALATAIGACVNSGTLFFILRRRGWFVPDARLKQRTIRLFLATGVMAAAVEAAEWGLQQWPLTHGVMNAGLLSALILLAVLVFSLAAIVLGVVKRADFALFKRLRRRPAKSPEQEPPQESS